MARFVAAPEPALMPGLLATESDDSHNMMAS
jgi:hypothetical protein